MKKALIALIALALVSPVLAQDQPDGPPPGVQAAHNQIARFLQLDEEQVAAWDEIYRIHREAEQPIKEEIAAVQAELEELMAADDPDPAAVGELVLLRRELGEALFEVHVVYHEDFVALLDEDQLRRLNFIKRADDAQRFIPAFKAFELIPRR